MWIWHLFLISRHITVLLLIFSSTMNTCKNASLLAHRCGLGLALAKVCRPPFWCIKVPTSLSEPSPSPPGAPGDRAQSARRISVQKDCPLNQKEREGGSWLWPRTQRDLFAYNSAGVTPCSRQTTTAGWRKKNQKDFPFSDTRSSFRVCIHNPPNDLAWVLGKPSPQVCQRSFMWVLLGFFSLQLSPQLPKGGRGQGQLSKAWAHGSWSPL